MSDKNKNRVCPLENANKLDGWYRKFMHNPNKILRDNVKPNMTVLDFGCGPGFFSIEAANLVGDKGKVIAADLQQGMLDIVQSKIQNTYLEKRLILHKCDSDKIGLNTNIDFAYIFYVVHEVPNQKSLFKEIYSILKPNCRLLIVEPKFHVSEIDFANMLKLTESIGFKPISYPKIFFSRAVVLEKK
jgi:ubiquinone/menaquinone biosynthesis C-methylase UbiE